MKQAQIEVAILREFGSNAAEIGIVQMLDSFCLPLDGKGQFLDSNCPAKDVVSTCQCIVFELLNGDLHDWTERFVRSKSFFFCFFFVSVRWIFESEP